MAEETTTMEGLILQKAEELFMEKGFAMTSTVEIARAVGCNQALIHYYYRTKEKLFLQIFALKARLFFSTFLEIDRSGDDFLTKFRRKIEAHFDILVKNPKLPFLIINELITNPARIEYLRGIILQELEKNPIFHTFSQELAEAIHEGKVRSIQSIDLIQNVIALNAVSIMALPILSEVQVRNGIPTEMQIKNRKKEVVETLMRSLKP